MAAHPAGEEGYKAILVNGEVTFEDERCTGTTPGRLLRHGHAEMSVLASASAATKPVFSV